MFGLGFGEVLVILVVVLLVFGPEKLPDIARTLGKTMAELRRTVDDIKHELTVPRLDEFEPPAASSVEPPAASSVEPPAASSVEPPAASSVEPTPEKKLT